METKTRKVGKVVLKAGNLFDLIILFALGIAFSLFVHAFIVKVKDWPLYFTTSLTLPFIFLMVIQRYCVFFIFDDYILIRHPLRFKNRKEIILNSDIKYCKYKNSVTKGPHIIFLYPKRIDFKRKELEFYDLFNKKEIICLRHFYNKGIEIDLSICHDPEKVLKKIKSSK